MSPIEREAMSLYPRDAHPGFEDPDWGNTGLVQVYTSDDLQEAYMQGAYRRPTIREVEAAARIMWNLTETGRGCRPWDEEDHVIRQRYLDMVGKVLDAARIASAEHEPDASD